MQQVALGWLVYRLTRSAFLLGLVGFAGQIPSLFVAPVAGGLAGLVGAPRTVQLGGAACLLGAVAFARALPGIRAQLRPIYVQLGILPEVASGLQTATEPGTTR